MQHGAKRGCLLKSSLSTYGLRCSRRFAPRAVSIEEYRRLRSSPLLTSAALSLSVPGGGSSTAASTEGCLVVTSTSLSLVSSPSPSRLSPTCCCPPPTPPSVPSSAPASSSDFVFLAPPPPPSKKTSRNAYESALPMLLLRRESDGDERSEDQETIEGLAGLSTQASFGGGDGEERSESQRESLSITLVPCPANIRSASSLRSSHTFTCS